MKKEIAVKFKIVFVGLILVYIIITARLFYLSVYKYNKDIKNRIIINNSRRLNIVDKNDIIVATDVDTISLYLNNSLINNEKNIAKSFAPIINIPENILFNRLKNRSKKANLILVKRNLTPNEHLAIKKIGIDSVVFEHDLMRFYPNGNLLSHILGYTDIDRNGIIGLEEYYDKYLKNSSNKPLKLTVNIRVQSIIRDELLEAHKKYNTNFIVAIVAEVKTGNIVAAVAIPDFDINNVQNALLNDMYNRISLGVYEMGSVMKTFTLTEGFIKKVINKNDEINVQNEIRYANFTIKDGSHIRKNILTVEEGFALSSNKAMVHIINKIGKTDYMNFMENMGILEKMDIDINQVGFPLQPRVWKDINLATISYGYGLAITPLHIILGVNTIMNNGQFNSLRFSYQKQQKQKVLFDKRVTKIMKEMFTSAMEKGTGKLARVEGYDIGGKTGTAEIVNTEGYRKSTNRASFVAAFPMADPEYSLFVLMDNPTKSEILRAGTGGSVAAPLAGSIMKKILPILNIKPN